MRWGRLARPGAHLRIDPSPADRQPSVQAQPADEAAAATLIDRPDRMLTLTDGVVAIAITLLVLDLNAVDYHGSSAGDLWRALRHEDGRFVAFFIAFWVIARFWTEHRRVFRRVTRHDDNLAKRNFWFLFGISLLPFTTMLLGETHDNPLPVTLFSANLLLLSVSLRWLSHSVEAAGAASPPMDERQILRTRTRSVTTAALFVLPGILAWVIRPNSAELLFLLLLLADWPGQLVTRYRYRRAATQHR